MFLIDLSFVLYENNMSLKTTNEIWQEYYYEHFPRYLQIFMNV